MKNILQKLILISILLLFIPQASSISIPNFTSVGNGTINSGNGYWNEDSTAYGYTGSKNVYAVTELSQVNLIEPTSFASGGTSYRVINASSNTLYDAVVWKGYVYFIDGSSIKKKESRNVNNLCEANDTTAGGCITTIGTGFATYALRIYSNELYFLDGTVLKKLDSDDNVQTVFTIPTAAIPGGEARYSSFTIATNNSVLTVYLLNFAVSGKLMACTSASCITIYNTGTANLPHFTTLYTTATYIYLAYYCPACGGAPGDDLLFYISNGTRNTPDPSYLTEPHRSNRNRAYVGGYTLIGLAMQSNVSYETYNSNSIGVSSSPLSEGSGLVSYISKSVDVPNPNYYNDSVIPINVDLKFIISNDNHTNYANSLFWHLHARDPTGLEVEDHDLPVVCTQAQPWWDPLGVFTSFIIDNVEPWACDGTQTVQYTRTPGQFWLNGTYQVDLTEQIPGTTSVLATDSWNIVNNSATSKGSIVPPPGGSPDSQNPMKGVTDEFLSSGMMVVFIILIVFAAAGQIIGGLAGAVIGFGGGFLFCAAFGLIPMWALFLFAILVITAFAVMMGKAVVGGGQD